MIDMEGRMIIEHRKDQEDLEIKSPSSFHFKPQHSYRKTNNNDEHQNFPHVMHIGRKVCNYNPHLKKYAIIAVGGSSADLVAMEMMQKLCLNG